MCRSSVFHIIYVSGIYHDRQTYNKLAHIKNGVSCQSAIINYVSKYQLQHLIDAFHTTPTTYVNRGPKLLKLIGWRHYLCFRWVSFIPGTMVQTLGAEAGLTASQSGNMYNKSGNMYNRNKNMTECQSPSGNPAVEPISQVHSKYRHCLLHQFPQSQCKLFYAMLLVYQDYLICMLLRSLG